MLRATGDSKAVGFHVETSCEHDERHQANWAHTRSMYEAADTEMRWIGCITRIIIIIIIILIQCVLHLLLNPCIELSLTVQLEKFNIFLRNKLPNCTNERRMITHRTFPMDSIRCCPFYPAAFACVQLNRIGIIPIVRIPSIRLHCMICA